MTSSKKSKENTPTKKSFYAIAETSGQQFWFEENKYYDIDRLNAQEKDKITLIMATHNDEIASRAVKRVDLE